MVYTWGLQVKCYFGGRPKGDVNNRILLWFNVHEASKLKRETRRLSAGINKVMYILFESTTLLCHIAP